MMKVWQVVIMGCHPTSMLGTKLILEEAGNLIVLGTYSDWTEGAAIVRENRPELVLLDYCMSDDLIETMLPEMKKSAPSSHFIVMTDREGRELFQPLLKLGASGVLSKGASPSQLLQLIAGLREGFLSMPLGWLGTVVSPICSSEEGDAVLKLTATEKFIMEQIVQGVTYDKIALEIDVSRRSIDNYLRKIYVKLEVSTRAQAIEKYALYSHQIRPMYA
ncbi:DNA-binding response regulator, NarL/FixJ family, contains REC and HTH domains [Paenibacillus sophorae]|uniref:DNA-binding response regulator, NarL/FixJ family, contains REC and HTH domains n=1 Tax=Paenibacillus sophorae TaxID=1333845 RepID=A0A1H8MER1_9BACL|nr:response regulator transcription factor [Paenibacillus sophorae]QWU17783.1 response regulator transcription factor [Paenibacillus sophorae]SEO15819.1 DNA-binding response regulator, NarL/FixJ family, contains REC and HTH domains [Paenibacillus sophorae]